MCGIVGFSGKTPLNADKILYLMQQNSWKRGRDATGFYTPETGVKKDSKVPEEFLVENPIPSAHTFIGHVRAATSGFKNNANAHPFEFTNIVGVHNGTLKNEYGMLRLRGVENTGLNVDSQMLYKLMDEDSKKDKIIYSTLSEYDGAAALLFQDKRNTKILYAYRNVDRPLFYGYLDKNMYISSIEESLKIIGCSGIFQFEMLKLYKIEDGKILTTQWFKEYEAPKYIKKNKHTINFNNPDCFKLLSQGSFDEIDMHTSSTSTINEDRIYVNNINKLGLINVCELKDRWIRVLQDKLVKYGDDEVRLTKTKWYFISDYDVKNNYDIKIESDDNGNSVWIPKFIVDADLVKIGDYVVTINPIVDKGKDIFKSGQILEVYDPRCISHGSHCVEVLNEETNSTILLYITTVRCATPEEIAIKLKQKEDKANTDTTPFVEAEVVVNCKEKSEEFVKNFFDGVDDEDEKDDASIHATEEVENDNPYDSLIPYSFLETALSIVMSKIIDLKDLSETTNFKELKEGIEELEEMTEEMFDLKKIELVMEDQKLEESEVSQSIQ